MAKATPSLPGVIGKSLRLPIVDFRLSQRACPWMKTNGMKLFSIPRFCILAMMLCMAIAASAQEGPPQGEGMSVAGARGIRGTVTAIAGNSATIKTDEGDVYRVMTGANTRIMKDRGPAKIADMHIGDMLIAGGEVDTKAKTVGAVFVAIVDAEQVKKMREDLGKTWLAGAVTAIQDLKISIKRIDGASQTFTVDENTSFKKRHDSITLADIHVGDSLTARGALKDDVFVATIVNVRPRGEGSPRGMDSGHGEPPARPGPQ